MQMVKELRARTGASIGKCHKALRKTGNVKDAKEWLQGQGIKSIARRSTDVAEALLGLEVHSDVGAVVKLQAETDFVTRCNPFQQLVAALARTAILVPEGDLLDARLDNAENIRGISEHASVRTALLELGSVLGERLQLGEYHRIVAPPTGAVGGYIHRKQMDSLPNMGRIAALVSIATHGNQSPDENMLQSIASQLARHVAAANPRFLSTEQIPETVLQQEKALLREAFLTKVGKRRPRDDILVRVVEGQLRKFFKETVLNCQELIIPLEGKGKPPTVSQWLQKQAPLLGVDAVVIEAFWLGSL